MTTNYVVCIVQYYVDTIEAETCLMRHGKCAWFLRQIRMSLADAHGAATVYLSVT